MDNTENDYELPDLEQIVELLVYAPIGLLYEYETVLPQLIKRGKSQVKLARLLGSFALDRGSRQVNKQSAQVAEAAVGAISAALTDLGAAIGLAPPSPQGGNDATDDRAEAEAGSSSESVGAASTELDAVKESAVAKDASVQASVPLPIAGYDDLTARSIIDFLGDLTGPQLQRVQQYESDNRNRKTVLAKIDRLLA